MIIAISQDEKTAIRTIFTTTRFTMDESEYLVMSSKMFPTVPCVWRSVAVTYFPNHTFSICATSPFAITEGN